MRLRSKGHAPRQAAHVTVRGWPVGKDLGRKLPKVLIPWNQAVKVTPRPLRNDLLLRANAVAYGFPEPTMRNYQHSVRLRSEEQSKLGALCNTLMQLGRWYHRRELRDPPKLPSKGSSSTRRTNQSMRLACLAQQKQYPSPLTVCIWSPDAL